MNNLENMAHWEFIDFVQKEAERRLYGDFSEIEANVLNKTDFETTEAKLIALLLVLR